MATAADQMAASLSLANFAKATDLGLGLFHYEYALYNMNADRNVGAFSLGVPADASVTNIGFHDVGYHSGDGPGHVDFDGADWPSARAGGWARKKSRSSGTPRPYMPARSAPML